MTEARWTSSHQFNQAAEALGIRTDQVMAATVTADPPGLVVMFTPDDDDPETIWSALLRPDGDGILREEHRRAAGSLADLRRHIGDQLRRTLGEPGDA